MTRNDIKKANALLERLDRARWTLLHLSEGNTGAHLQDVYLDIRTGRGERQDPVQLLPQELEFVREVRTNEVRRLTAELEEMGIEPDCFIEPDC